MATLAPGRRHVLCQRTGNIVSVAPRLHARTSRPRAHQAVKSSEREVVCVSRRAALTGSVCIVAALSLVPDVVATPAVATSIEILDDQVGFGQRAAQKGDLLLLHYVGSLQETGAVFDSTRGGLTYRDGGEGVFRPVSVRLGGDPLPGICAGLRAGLEGMRVGGRRTFLVPPELGFRGTVLAPYAVVPAGSTLRYEVELIRLSMRGPDELTKGISRCGQGGAAQAVDNCSQIEPMEFLL